MGRDLCFAFREQYGPGMPAVQLIRTAAGFQLMVKDSSVSFNGQVIDRYLVKDLLGRGSFAVVYSAEDQRQEKEFALKMIRLNRFPEEHQPEVRAEVNKLARSVSLLSHPNIVKLHKYGAADGMLYLATDLVEGFPLKERTGIPRPWEDVIQLLAPAVEAVAYAHSLGILHRDLRPANLFIDRSGRLLVTDFGITRLLERVGLDLGILSSGIQDPEFRAPEEGLGEEVDGRADVYSMGAVLYELITGRRPYSADTELDVLQNQFHDVLPRPSALVPGLPPALELVMLKALAKKPADRYRNMASFSSALRKLAGTVS